MKAPDASSNKVFGGGRQDLEKVRRVCSDDIFRTTRELVIEHAGESYRLKITRNNKLILTK